MSLGPLLPGRIPNSLLYTRSLENLRINTRTFQQLQDQISTGQRFQTIGENSSAAVQTILLQQTRERQLQLTDNVEVNRSLLSASEDSLGKIGDVFNQMKSFVLAGLGNSVSATEKQQMATEVDTLIRQVVNLGNQEFRGRFLFGGSDNRTAPFTLAAGNNAVRYNGNLQQLDSYITADNLLANNVGVQETLKPLAILEGGDLNPALTSATRLSDLFGGNGLQLGTIEVTVDTGGGPQTAQIDLTGAQTVADLKTRLEAPFAGDLTVSIGTSSLQLTPSAGTVAVTDLPNSKIAAKMGISGVAAAAITSHNFDPQLSRLTTLAALNGGTGIGAVAGNGLLITNGQREEVIDLDGLTTIEDLFNAIESADLDLMTGFTDDGTGLKIASRLSGVGFTIGENGGQNASLLGIRTFSGQTTLAELNLGHGVPVGGDADLSIVRRDGTSLDITLAGAQTVQEVIDLINAVDPGVLTASLNTTGNGITLNDTSGQGELVITETAAATALGMAGADDGNADLVGTGIGISAASDPLAALNGGGGVPVGAGTLDITRRDGAVLNIDLSLAVTVQDVLDTVNVIDPGNLVLTVDEETGGFRLNDNSDIGELIVADNAVSQGLGIAGSEDGVNEISGTDTNQQRAGGVLDLLYRLSGALTAGDNRELEQIDKLLEIELSDFNFQRGAVAGRLKSLDFMANRLADQDILIQESISNVFDTDIALAITQFTNLQATIQASQQIASRTLQLNLFNYI